MELSKLFKTGRKAKRLTLREVEVKTGISNPYLSQLENGKISSPSFKVVVTLCQLYEIDASILFDHEKSVLNNKPINILDGQSVSEFLEVENFIRYTISKRNNHAIQKQTNNP